MTLPDLIVVLPNESVATVRFIGVGGRTAASVRWDGEHDPSVEEQAIVERQVSEHVARHVGGVPTLTRHNDFVDSDTMQREIRQYLGGGKG